MAAMLSHLKKRSRIKKFPVFETLTITAIVAVVLGSFVFNRLVNQRSGPRRLLEDGEYQVISVIDPLSFVVRRSADDSRGPATNEDFSTFEFKLAGIKFLSSEPGTGRANAQSFVKRFIANKSLSIRFDRHRYDHQNTALGYLYADGEMLNIALVANRFATPDPIQGNSGSIHSKLQQAETASRQSESQRR